MYPCKNKTNKKMWDNSDFSLYEFSSNVWFKNFNFVFQMNSTVFQNCLLIMPNLIQFFGLCKK